MKDFLPVFYVLCVTFTLQAVPQKYEDEGKPYEFGFTIDGQQHRHEKKDVNGIIEGEFGFITADGIYHVTVYATDENGNFRILSMRNVRISAPLDGSGTPEQKQISAQTPNVQPPSQNIRPQVEPGPTTSRAPYRFTTQSTIKPACGGCGYVTTSKTPPGNKFPFQNPSFRNQETTVPNSGVQNAIVEQDTRAQAGPQGPSISSFQNANAISGGIGYTNQDIINPYIERQGKEIEIQQPYIEQQGKQFEQPSPYIQGPAPPPPQESQQTPPFQDSAPSLPVQPINPQGFPPQYQNSNQPEGLLPGQGFVEAQYPPGNAYSSGGTYSPQLPQNQPLPKSRLSQVTVSGGVIKVPGNPDIPIKDKYPNMVDGLPRGIEEKDITDLLYKFNYTVGFHGHYEKGLKNGAKIGGYFVNGRDGISRIVTYVADENGYRPKFKFIRLGLDSVDTPQEGTEKSFGLKNFEFIWYPIS